MNYRLRKIFLLCCDAVLVNLALFVAFAIRFPAFEEVSHYLKLYLWLFPYSTAVFLAIFYTYRLYNRDWAYASLGELIAIVQSTTLGSIAVIAPTYILHQPLPRSVSALLWAFTIILMGGSRVAWRLYVERAKTNGHRPERRALIIGAGDAGAMVARELKSHNGVYLPVGFIDDDPNKQQLTVLGLPVLGGRSQIPGMVKRHNVKLIILAMPSVENTVIREIVEICRDSGAELKILPGVYQIIDGEVSVNHLRPVQLEDLLRREPVRLDLNEIAGYLRGETILITGAGGSIGSELCRQVATFEPGKLILFGHGENSIHGIWLELAGKYPNLDIITEIADVRDRPKVEYIFAKHQPAVVFHAAAHKHVPFMEMHPDESVKTNVFGTRNVAEAADATGTKIFVMISTDKAVNPSSVMGATKRMAELIIQQMNQISTTRYTAVRFGNVLGSRGSVVPVFQRQIEQGGPVTVTHPDMKRYFMTIPEAVQLVIQAGSMAKGGEVFVLDMGVPVKIVDLARDMIKLSGLEPEKDIMIKFTGIRTGEKLFEELLTSEEGSSATQHKRIFMARQPLVELQDLEFEVANLFRKGLYCTAEDIFTALTNIVPNFKQYRQDRAG